MYKDIVRRLEYSLYIKHILTFLFNQYTYITLTRYFTE